MMGCMLCFRCWYVAHVFSPFSQKNQKNSMEVSAINLIQEEPPLHDAKTDIMKALKKWDMEKFEVKNNRDDSLIIEAEYFNFNHIQALQIVFKKHDLLYFVSTRPHFHEPHTTLCQAKVVINAFKSSFAQNIYINPLTS